MTLKLSTYEVIKVSTPEILEDVMKNCFTFPECDTYLGCYEVLQTLSSGEKEYIGPYRTQAEANEARVSLTRSQRLLREGRHISTTGT
tara:strand:- start:1995 stop:2258 length:264 start_codon:yes stop_codon:yes gene_type:complete